MRVLLLDLGLELRGGQRQVHYLARALDRTPGIEAVTACPAEGKLADALRSAGLPVAALPGRSPANPRLYAWLGSRLRDFPVDIVHTHDANAATMGAIWKVLHGGAKLVHSRRVSYPLRPGLRSWKYRMADAVVGVSREIAEGLIRAGIPASRVSAIHSGIDPSRYRRREARADGPFPFSEHRRVHGAKRLFRVRAGDGRTAGTPSAAVEGAHRGRRPFAPVRPGRSRATWRGELA